MHISATLQYIQSTLHFCKYLCHISSHELAAYTTWNLIDCTSGIVNVCNIIVITQVGD